MRVITGTARGRRLEALPGLDTRPTTDRVKESVFNVIQFDVEGRRALDLFAGSGQMGIAAPATARTSPRTSPAAGSGTAWFFWTRPMPREIWSGRWSASPRLTLWWKMV